MDIEGLCDIKRVNSGGIDALQLYKIPTRKFQKYFYYHELKWVGKTYNHQLSRL